ncbi:MsnO8 family LLM class oxidoreductase [Aerococcaceae bacterium WS4759]|uniref:MsnO8 family LLM class oxidoreductase n=1 Tax=Fundicoccus ignavus TaxID=2664442 RepID=A0A6I2GDK0_9LACT|nr:MsnO8 family LLM class oxidoreductase [Fundicoccus ignavus]MRI85887.1 MsnO8 family LLM class oxidoreductase [Fundicoccus ignavus]
MDLELGVHDLITLNGEERPEAAYIRTAEFVKEIEAMNFKRHWFAEHHNSPTHASVSPELLTAYMSAITSKLRLGTGGTMIMHYSPLKIAEDFKTLTALAPNRIDIGLGRAPGSGSNEIVALAQGKPNAFDDQYDKIEVILDYLLDQRAASFYGNTKAAPLGVETLPEPWMLGSSGQSATKAAEMGLGYSFAKFFGLETDPAVFELYRKQFKASEFFQEPTVMVSYMVVIADSQEEADYLAKPIEMQQIALRRGRMIRNADPEAVKDYEFTPGEVDYLNNNQAKRFILKGTPEKVQRLIEEEQALLGINELLAYSPIFDPQKRLDSYKHLARMFNKI